MSRSNSGKRLFNEKEVGELIQRATELHEGAAGASDQSLSLEEVEHIASELGISPQHVRSAALELSQTSRAQKKFSLFGAPFSVSHSRILSEPMNDEQWALVVAELRRSFGSRGQAETIGDTKEWSRTVEDMGTIMYGEMVSARSEEEQTSLALKKHFGGLGFLMYFVAAIAWFLGSLIVLESLDLPQTINFILFAAAGVGGFAAIRAGVSRWKKRQLENLKALADRIHLTISSNAKTIAKSAPQQKERSENVIEIPEEEAEEELANRSSQRTRI